ncbi:dimethylaniline monooxygenase [N-oxide-forming] 2-like isoform X2 [Ascaphus truei]|uniref:dimethylaniline monooxygenase [N-oxide-forming] 2-like isoform X2 n=1 Tax=Ascaphus truei TaxID=8439 RepID=UPI003F5A0A41
MMAGEKVEDGRASIYKSMVSNISKEIMCYSDFPMPEDFPNFLPNRKVFEYCKMYAEQFHLLKHIKFQTVVCSVRRHSDFPSTGQWVIVTETNGEKETAIFDAVMICTGQHEKPFLPLDSYPGINKFKGQILHGREYKMPVGFDGKRVLIVGMGNSGVDLSTELSRAAQVYLSSRRGVWVLRRLGDGGYPWDVFFVTRFKNWIRNALPPAMARWLMKRYLNNQFNHEVYGLQPEGIMWKEPLVNEELPSRILCGSVVLKSKVIEFTETSARFGDGTTAENLDVVIFTTGYNFSFPFLEESIIKVDNSNGFLYKMIFPPDLQKPTLAVIGLILPIGPVMTTAELQSRWATKVFKGLHKLPNTKEIQDDLAREVKQREKWFATSKENARRTDYITYMDDLASLIGVKPNIFRLFLSDPVLAMKMFFGPCNPYQYRLTGPGKWAGAREAILNQWDRIDKPIRLRVIKQESYLSLSSLLLGVLCFVALIAAFLVKS